MGGVAEGGHGGGHGCADEKPHNGAGLCAPTRWWARAVAAVYANGDAGSTVVAMSSAEDNATVNLRTRGRDGRRRRGPRAMGAGRGARCGRSWPPRAANNSPNDHQRPDGGDGGADLRSAAWRVCAGGVAGAARARTPKLLMRRRRGGRCVAARWRASRADVVGQGPARHAGAAARQRALTEGDDGDDTETASAHEEDGGVQWRARRRWAPAGGEVVLLPNRNGCAQARGGVAGRELSRILGILLAVRVAGPGRRWSCDGGVAG